MNEFYIAYMLRERKKQELEDLERYRLLRGYDCGGSKSFCFSSLLLQVLKKLPPFRTSAAEKRQSIDGAVMVYKKKSCPAT